ncbi:MAG: saccharopine dehydrogenase NADP-binding domain-containing protein [Candidatus Peribacteraceae bacterium]|nr:saccharopine dehydrogenase NADP-binding domain-containing protein [Candidatus Peribacteraceae bacterium]
MEAVEPLASRLRTSFGGRVLLLGYGGVAQCTLPMLLRHLDMPRDRITVMDFVDHGKNPLLQPALQEGVTFVCEKIERATMGEQFGKYLGAGDLLIDLAWNIGAVDILQWCHDHGVLYVNTSVEQWDPYEGWDRKLTTDRTLYVRHMAIREMVKGWKEPGPTAILEHGANPGLVSHFTKRGLVDIAKKLMAEKPGDARIKDTRKAVDEGAYPRLAQLLDVKVIHISEIDTQISDKPHDPSAEFVNTWSVEGFYEEGTAPAEMGWGTHERILPPGARCHVGGPRNQICMARFGIDTFVRTRVPSRDIVGMVVRHGEAFTISDYLTVNGADGTPVYRPTVHYAYLPAAAVASLQGVRERGYKMQEKYRIMGDDIVSGVDELGCLLMGHDFKSWWTGTILSIEEARTLVPGMNATTMQVAASVLGAVFWMIKNPQKGVLVPDQLPHEEILAVASPYLGEVPSVPLDWTPQQSPMPSMKADTSFSPADDDPWQFHHFLLPDTYRPSVSKSGSLTVHTAAPARA